MVRYGIKGGKEQIKTEYVGIKGTFYYPKSSKKYTVFEPWNSMKNEIQGKKLGMSTMKRQLFTTC